MTRHEQWAQRQGRKLTLIQGRYELWEDGHGNKWLYDMDRKTWHKTEMVPV